MANLILWRHAEAEVDSATGKDTDRVLTKRGRKDAQKMAKWLYAYLPDNTEILCSPARRCQETIAALQHLSALDDRRKNGLKVTVAEFLSIDSSVQTIANKIINDDISKTILVVGHQPNLGRLIAKTLGMDEAACAVKKGAVWWLRQRFTPGIVAGKLQSYLYTVQLPRY